MPGGNLPGSRMKTPARRLSLLAMVVSIVGVAALSGCREDEQDRIMVFEQGTYQGNPDSTLASDQVGELRARAREQQY